MTEIAFIGLGKMGAGMADRLISCGYSVRVYNRTRAKAEPFQGKARICESAKEAVQSAEFVITMLYDGHALESILKSDGGIFSEASRGTVLIDMSTGDPHTLIEFADNLDKFGVEVVDAPVIGYPMTAKSGQLKIIASGSESALKKCEPIFSCLGTRTFRVGKLGNGKNIKMVNALLLCANLTAVAEAISFSNSLGVELRQLYEIIKDGSGTSFAFSTGVPKVMNQDFKTGGSTELLAKDLSIVENMCKREHLHLPVTEKVANQFSDAVKESYGSLNEVGIVKKYLSQPT
jgi:3-hydroxyisobutyrate dehydrogenase